MGPRQIEVKLDTRKTTYFDSPTGRDSRYAASADSAFKIMSAVFSSQEFQDSLTRTTFRCAAYYTGCSGQGNKRLPGAEVIDKLFQEQHPTIALELNKDGGPLGQTSRQSYYTQAWYESIRQDMPDLPFALALAVNLCHEYMHQVGFVHLYCTGWWPKCAASNKLREVNREPDPRFLKDDVTYRVGWIAYRIIKRKQQAKESLF